MSRCPPPERSILALPALLETLAQRRAAGERVVFTNGCFDLLHQGHVRYLRAAAELGDVLVVGLNGDESVRRIKGPGRPLLPTAARAELLAALGFVDYVVVFEQPTAEHLVAALRPEIYVKGGDYAGREPPEAVVARAQGSEFRALELVPGISTSDLIRRIRDGAR